MKLRITIDGRAYAVEVEPLEEEAPPAEEERYAPLPAAQPQGLPGNAVNADPNVCRSPVNGLVIKVNVERGQMVEEGAPILVLEAMKMETVITAPRPARVQAVLAKPGDPVKIGQVLVEFEDGGVKEPEKAADE